MDHVEAMDYCPMPTPKKRPRRLPTPKHVYVEMPTGYVLHWMVVEPYTIEDVKEKIYHDEGIPVEKQRLVLEVPNDRIISDPVKMTDESHFILMPMYYNNFKAKEKALDSYVDTSDEEGEEEEEHEKEEDNEQEEAKEEFCSQELTRMAKEEFCSQEWIGAELFGDTKDA